MKKFLYFSSSGIFRISLRMQIKVCIKAKNIMQANDNTCSEWPIALRAPLVRCIAAHGQLHIVVYNLNYVVTKDVSFTCEMKQTCEHVKITTFNFVHFHMRPDLMVGRFLL